MKKMSILVACLCLSMQLWGQNVQIRLWEPKLPYPFPSFTWQDEVMVRGEVVADTAVQKLNASMLCCHPNAVVPCAVTLYFQEGENKKKAIFQTKIKVKPLQNTLLLEVMLEDGRKERKTFSFPASYNNGDYSDNFNEMAHATRHKDAVRSLSFTADSRYLISGGDDGMILVMNPTTLEVMHKFKAHTHYVRKAVATPDNRYIVSCSEDRTVKIWEFPAGKPVYTFTDHKAPVYALAVSPDGKYIASGGQSVIIWEFASRKQVATFTSDKFANYSTLSFSCDSQYLFCGDEDRWLNIWDVGKKESKYKRRNIHKTAIKGFAIHPSMLYFYSGASDGSGKWWQLLLNPRDNKWEDEDHIVWEMRLNQVKGRFEDPAIIPLDYVKANVADFPKIQSYPLYYLTKDGDDLPEKDWRDKIERPLTDFKGGVIGMDITANGEYLMVAANEGMIRIIETLTGLKRWSVELNHLCESGAFAQDGAFAAIGSLDGQIWVYGVKR